MQASLPKISIITVNFNQAEVTARLLDSLRLAAYPDLEIFVVDNASKEDASWLKTDYPEIIYISSDKNLGFAGGNNLAIHQAKGAFVLLINNDTEVPPGFLQPMVQTFHDHSDAGIVSPTILFYHTPGLIQYAGTGAIQPLTCRGFTRGYGEMDKGQYKNISQTDLAHGACMMIHAKVLRDIPGLSEDFFLYYEEYDFCEQAKRLGYTIYHCGLSEIYHKESISVGKLSPLKAYYMARNRIVFAKRNFSGFNRFSSILYYYCLALPKHLFTEIAHRRYTNAKALLKGARDGFTFRPIR